MIGELEGTPEEILKGVRKIIAAIEPSAVCDLRSDRSGVVCWVVEGEGLRVDQLTFRPKGLGGLSKEAVRHAGFRLRQA